MWIERTSRLRTLRAQGLNLGGVVRTTVAAVTVPPLSDDPHKQKVLYCVVREHLRTLLWELGRHDEERGAPLLVEDEFQRFVCSSVLAYGFARCRWTDCGTDRLVA